MLNVLKVLIGIFLGLLTMGVLSASAGYYFFVTNLSAKPTRPKFAEERNPPKPSAKPVVPKPVASPDAEGDTEKADVPEKELPPGAYDATVTWENGVSLRQEPNETSEKIGSVGFKEKITVVKENKDKSWVQVRKGEGSVEGWLKIGNIKRDAVPNTNN